MCGIAGFTGPANQSLLSRMIGALQYRGPDDEGCWVGDSVSFGMRRLSIVDIKLGTQPVFNETGDIVAVFNGEIFNYIELRKQLEKRGHHFKSHHSDSETIVHLYEEYGDDFLHHLNGMFAIALWDEKKKRLLLARDRSGIKPLFYAHVGGKIIFASEIKSLLIDPDVSRRPDVAALHHYFALKNTPAPQTAYENIKQLRAGEMLEFSEGSISKKIWWRADFAEPETPHSEDEAASHILQLLEDSISLQVRADVPFGAFLSGGVDSSAVALLAARHAPQKLDTFTLVYEDNFDGKDQDREFARMMAKHIGSQHHEHILRPPDVLQSLDDVVCAFDEPFSGVTSTFFLSEAITKHVKVALSGDGADELFGSYATHRAALPLALLRSYDGDINKVPDDQRGLLAAFSGNAQDLLPLLAAGDEIESRFKLSLASEDERRALYSSQMRSRVTDVTSRKLFADIYNESGSTDPLNRTLYVDQVSLLPDQVLAFVDRLSMAHSLEVRPPFLDHRMISYAASLSGDLKIKNGRVKHILKEALGSLLPQSLLDRPKEGFVMPVNQWLKSHYQGYVEGLLCAKNVDRSGILAGEEVEKLVRAFYAGHSVSPARIWNLVMFQVWVDKYDISL